MNEGFGGLVEECYILVLMSREESWSVIFKGVVRPNHYELLTSVPPSRSDKRELSREDIVYRTSCSNPCLVPLPKAVLMRFLYFKAFGKNCTHYHRHASWGLHDV